jgi:hypothetical protein
MMGTALAAVFVDCLLTPLAAAPLAGHLQRVQFLLNSVLQPKYLNVITCPTQLFLPVPPRSDSRITSPSLPSSPGSGPK